jgi:hypothetical protein
MILSIVNIDSFYFFTTHFFFLFLLFSLDNLNISLRRFCLLHVALLTDKVFGELLVRIVCLINHDVKIHVLTWLFTRKANTNSVHRKGIILAISRHRTTQNQIFTNKRAHTEARWCCKLNETLARLLYLIFLLSLFRLNRNIVIRTQPWNGVINAYADCVPSSKRTLLHRLASSFHLGIDSVSQYLANSNPHWGCWMMFEIPI